MLIKSYEKEGLLYPFEVKDQVKWTESVAGNYYRTSQARQWIAKLPTHRVETILDRYFVDGTPFGTLIIANLH